MTAGGEWLHRHKRVINYTGVLLCTKGLAGVQCQPLWPLLASMVLSGVTKYPLLVVVV